MTYMQDENCIFCKIVCGRIPAKVLTQNNRAIALLDAFPLAEGHTLVIPKSHYAKVQDMSEQDSMAVFEIIWKIVGAVEAGSNVNASTIAIHNGNEAVPAQTPNHLHQSRRHRGDLR